MIHPLMRVYQHMEHYMFKQSAHTYIIILSLCASTNNVDTNIKHMCLCVFLIQQTMRAFTKIVEEQTQSGNLNTGIGFS